MRASAAVSAERAAYVRPTRIIFQGNAAAAALLTIRKWEVEVEEEERRPFTMLPLWNRDAAAPPWAQLYIMPHVKTGACR